MQGGTTMIRLRLRYILPLYSVALLAIGAMVGAQYTWFTKFGQWAKTAPLHYNDSDRHYVELALDVYTAHSIMTHAQALEEVYPLVVDFPGAVCVALHHRPGWTDSESTICFDSKSDALLTDYRSDVKGQHMPAELSPPHYGEVLVSGPGSPSP